MMPSMVRGVCCLMLTLIVLAPGRPRAQAGPGALHAPLDKILDTYVRDGFVYYLALQKERGALDRYVAALDIPRTRIDSWPKADQEAFWLNAYDAFVLRTVIDAYPIKGRSAEYPPKSIRQIPGAFETLKHRAGGQSLTLDQIEKNILLGFGDARVVLAIGRGAIGSGRLRSEAFQGPKLEAQLALAVEECASRVNCVKVDRDTNLLDVTPLVSWREDAFIQSFSAAGQAMWPNRTPIERAVAGMIFPHMFPSERDYLKANTWQMKYGAFDWRLNDLTGGVPE